MKKIPIIIVAFICLISVFGISLSAEWIYPDMSISYEKDSQTEVTLNEFGYAPEEVLPGGDNDEEVIVGENHLMLIQNIVDHVTYGLNATDKPIVREYLENGVGVVYSNQKVSGGNLKHMLIDDYRMEKLDFAVKYETSSFYTSYTFESKYLETQYLGSIIACYKTDMVKEGNIWVAKRSYHGTVKVATVRAEGKQIINVDVSTWVEGYLDNGVSTPTN